jgi:hypothetical protein
MPLLSRLNASALSEAKEVWLANAATYMLPIT